MDRRFFSFVAVVVMACGTGRLATGEQTPRKPSGAGSTIAKQVDFNAQIKPLLSDRCFKCHGPDESAREADLRLDLRTAAEDVLSADDPKQSELLRRITSTDADEQMPPPDSKLRLGNGEIDLLKRWIEQGARYERHWAFTPVQPVALPKVKQAAWPRNPIDQFILARLEREGIAPTREASKETLIRRLCFELTGLPPTPRQIDAFLADDSACAYERLVEQLLATSSYGERMASEWLDVGRYSDSFGYQQDKNRFVWPWRDWVVGALNRNMPYDQFITWQLAGDLLPGATDQQILATTFNRLHSQKVEGGSTPEEFRVEYVADRNHTFGTAFLGLSLECARCHEHKYDPITQQEYYQLFAFFNNIDEAGLCSWYTKSVPTPTLMLADMKKKSQIAALEQQIDAAEQALLAVAREREKPFAQWLANRPAEPTLPGRIARLDFENHKDGANKSVPGKLGKAVRLSGDDGIGLKVGNFRRYDSFSVTLWINTPDVKERAIVFHRSKAWTDAGSRGYQLLIEKGKLSASLIHFWPGNAIRVRTREPIAIGKWIHVAITYDGSSRAAGLRIFIDGQLAACEVVRDHLHKNITGGGGDNITIGQRSRDRGFKGGRVDEFRVYSRQLTSIEVAQDYDNDSLAKVLAKPVAQLTATEKSDLKQYCLATVDDAYQKQLSALRAVRKAHSTAIDAVTEIMVMREMANRRPTHLLKRGAYDAPQQRVEPGTPAAFPPMPDGAPRNRLGLARWLTDPRHPLTARVAVNRYWQMCFGRGLVSTPEDFGSQGKAPTHSALLDWLARDFMDHGWNVKRLMKMLVTSATYRQSSAVSRAQRSRDPENLLLGRAPSFRMPAEMIRDNALAASGLLVERVGGAPVRPYEVAVSFKPLPRDKGEGLYRRSLYTYWKRTAPGPMMITLDAARREVCSVKRERTASPLQAVVLLNGPQFVEAARLLAENELRRHPTDVDAMIASMFRRLISRYPRVDEKVILRKLYSEQLSDFKQHGEKAEQLLKTGDMKRDERLPAPQVAAATVLANTLMNFDPCVVKR